MAIHTCKGHSLMQMEEHPGASFDQFAISSDCYDVIGCQRERTVRLGYEGV